jgi:hypothetical protein
VKLHLSADVGGVTVTLIESVFWTAMIIDPSETELDRRLMGERADITEVTRDEAIRQIADRLVTIHLSSPFSAEQIRAHTWLVGPMRDELLARANLIARELNNNLTPIHPDSYKSMSEGAARCRVLHAGLMSVAVP